MESKAEMSKSRRGYRAQDSVTSFTDATSTANGRNSRRGLSETEEDQDVFGDDKAANDSTEMTTMSGESPKPLSAARLSNDDHQSRRISEDRRSARSEGRRSIGGQSSYEDASVDDIHDDEEDEDDARSTRSVYEDAPSAEVPTAPAHIGSRGFLRRKPVEQY